MPEASIVEAEETQLISDDYLKQQKELHDKGNYGISGQIYAQGVMQLAMATGSQQAILDYGCGQQTLQNALPQFQITGYDPCIAGLDADPVPHDLVVCTDVLEHIEPDMLDNVLDHIQTLALKAVFLTVATRPAKKILSDGRNAHLIVEDMRWWMPKLWDRWVIGTVQNVDDKTLIVTGVPRD